MDGDYLLTVGLGLTHLLVVKDLERAQRFYCDILGAEIRPHQDKNSVVLSVMGSWLTLIKGGGLTPDKPGLEFSTPDPEVVSHVLWVRVTDCQAAYRVLQARGAQFLAPPVVSESQVCCYSRDPDGHLLEISEAVFD